MKFINEKENKDKIGIYLITNLINDKKYVGQTSDRFIERYWNHLWKLKNNHHDNKFLQEDFNNYGSENFEFSVLHILNQDDDIDYLEKLYIKNYGINNLYNIQYGGKEASSKGVKRSEETKRKISEANKIALLGKKHSDDTKKKMSEIRSGVTQWGKCKISYELAYNIKTMLMDGNTPKQVSDILSVDYKIINNIYSNNSYKSVFVEGWNEFYKKTRKPKTLSNNDILRIQDLISQGYSISSTSKITGFSRESIRKYK